MHGKLFLSACRWWLPGWRSPSCSTFWDWAPARSRLSLGGVDSLWPLVALAVFYLVIRYGVVAREEAYLERKFGDAYLDHKARVRRWVTS